MDPLNPDLQRRVWSRVMCAPVPCCQSAPCVPEPDPCPPEPVSCEPVPCAPAVPVPLPLQRKPTCGHTRQGGNDWLPLLAVLILLSR